MPVSCYNDLHGQCQGFTKILVGTFQKKAATFAAMEPDPSNLALSILYSYDALPSCKKLEKTNKRSP